MDEKSHADAGNCVSTEETAESVNSNGNALETPEPIDTSSSDINSSYYLVCNFCKNTLKYKNFEQFLQHIKAAHASEFMPDAEIDLSSIGIGVNKIESRPESSLSGIRNSYDLRTLTKTALIDVIKVFSQCACLWHEPTRARWEQVECFSAYQLMLSKLREHEAKCTLQDVRNIAEQLLNTIKKVLNGANSQLTIGGSGVQTNINELHPPNSQIILSSLKFLIFEEKEDIKEMDVNKLCSFCNASFPVYDDLWTHMKSAHTSIESPTSVTNKSEYLTATEDKDFCRVNKDNSEGPISENKFKRYFGECNSLANNNANSNNENNNSINFGSINDNSNNNNSNIKNINKNKRAITRRSSTRLSKNQEIDKKLWEESSPKLRQRKRRAASLHKKYSYSETTSGESDLDVKPSSYYLNQYNDEFLIKFIESFRQKECLWKSNSDLYRDRQVKEKAYEDLIKEHCQMLPHQPKPSTDLIKNLIRRLKYYYKRCRSYTAKRPITRHYIWQKLSFMEDEKGNHNYEVRSRHPSSHSLVSKPSTTNYDCTKCLKKFKRAHYLNNHMIRQHPPTFCPKCREDFADADNLKTHIVWYHRKDTECPMCTTKPIGDSGDWKSNGHLAVHFYDHQCDNCDRTFHDYTNYTKHRTQCRQKHKHCKCAHCNKYTSKGTQLSQHSAKKHYYISRLSKPRFKHTKSSLKHRN